MRQNEVYAIDLRSKNPSILIFGQDEIDTLKKDNKVKDVVSLSNYDVKIFKTWHEANDFLNRYLKTESDLEKFKLKKDKIKMPSLLYKKRYLIQTLMKEKNQTVRDSERIQKMMSKVKRGEKFRLYDQKHEIIVTLTKSKKLDDNQTQYDFEITS